MKSKWCIAAFLIMLVFGCATVTIHPAVGTVIEKFMRDTYAEHSALDLGGEWIPLGIGHLPTYWVSIQENGYRLEKPMKKDKWDAVKVGDIIDLRTESGGGT